MPSRDSTARGQFAWPGSLPVHHGRTTPIAAGLLLAWVLSTPAAGQSDDGGTERPREDSAAADPDTKTVSQALDALRKAEGDVERALARHALARLGPPALAAVREALAAERARPSPDRQFISSLEAAARRLLGARLAETIARRQESGLVFDGQYDDFKEIEGNVREALFHLLDDEASSLALRFGALNALADVATGEDLARVRQLEDDPFMVPRLKTELGVLMAILGDTSKVDHQIQRFERHATSTNPDLSLSANLQLSNLYYRIRKYSKATDCYERVLKIFELVRSQLPKEHQLYRAQFNDQVLALHHYNAACSYALDKKIEKAREHLRAAVRLDALHFKNMDLDGDLENLREAEGHEDFKKELSSYLQDLSI